MIWVLRQLKEIQPLDLLLPLSFIFLYKLILNIYSFIYSSIDGLYVPDIIPEWGNTTVNKMGPLPLLSFIPEGKIQQQSNKQYGFGFRYVIKEEINTLKLDRSWVDEIKGVF